MVTWESSSGPVLVSTGAVPLSDQDAARTALARIEFQLGTNAGNTTAVSRLWQPFVLFVRQAGHYLDFRLFCEEGPRRHHGACGAFSCNPVPRFGAPVHTCNTSCQCGATPRQGPGDDQFESTSQ